LKRRWEKGKRDWGKKNFPQSSLMYVSHDALLIVFCRMARKATSIIRTSTASTGKLGIVVPSEHVIIRTAMGPMAG